jgi:hypothetical protein
MTKTSEPSKTYPRVAGPKNVKIRLIVLNISFLSF